LGILTLVAAETTGIGSGIVQWCRIQGVVPGPAVSLLKETADSSTRMADGAELAALMDVATPSETVSCELAEHLDGDGVVDCIQPPIPSFEVASSRTRENSDVFRGRRSPTQGPNSHEFRYSPSNSATSSGVLFLVWGLGAMVLLVRMTWARWLLERFRRQQRRMDQPVVRQQVDRLAARLGITRRIEILTSPRLAAPIAFGFFRPVIALPAGFAEDFDDCQREAMLAHEVAHLASGDSGWQLLADLAAIMLWWHPLVWWLRRRWRAASELAADEACLLVPRGADALAACLVILARRLDSRPRLAWLSMAGPGLRSALGQRVERLLGLSACAWRPANRRWIGVVTATVPVAFLVLVISCTVWARTQAPVAERTTTMKVFVDGWRQSLAAVALAAVLGPVSGDGSSVVAAEDERPVPQVRGEREGDRPAEREREGDRPAEREREGDRPAEREREPAEREREGDRPAVREREGDRPAEREREGDRPGGEAREAPVREMAQRRAQLMEQAGEIRRKLASLRPDQDGDARELRGALERIEVQLRELQSPAPGRERLLARLEEVKAAFRRAQEAGRADEAERLEREGRELMQMLEQRPGDRPPGQPGGEEAQRRMQHLRAAIENLHAAGLHAQAEALARDGVRLAGGERPAAADLDRRPAAPRDVPAPGPQLERAVMELRGQVQELRQQMEEIRRHLREIAERR
jgi:beta-lactamase regulating signal transducer with metallopeptidase domain